MDLPDDVTGGKVTVWFNPACSNCRTTEGILADRGVDAELFEYLREKPSRADIERVMALLGTDDPRTIVRAKEAVYRELRLADATRDELLDAMAANPALVERPIVIRGDRAVVARPPERVLELLGPDGEQHDG